MQETETPPIVNLGSEEMISINELAMLIARIAHKNLKIQNIEGPEGVRGRNSDNALINEVLHWQPTQKLEIGLQKLYSWILEQTIQKKLQDERTNF